jgi:hypothetical protein
MTIKLYCDNDFNLKVVPDLRADGCDVQTSPEAGNERASDAEQLEHATSHGRVIVTFNRKHFKRLHSEWQAAGKAHAGILISGQIDRDELLRRLRNFLQTRTAQETANQLERLHDHQ